MQRALRIMWVGRSGSTGPLRLRLKAAHSLKFTARCVSSEGEVRVLAREFSPDVVLSTDSSSGSSNETLAQMLTLMSRQAPRILVCEVTGQDSIWSDSVATCPAALWPDTSAPNSVAYATPGLATLPAVFQDCADAAVIVDQDGWIREANASAAHLLSQRRPQWIAGAHQVHVEELILRLGNTSSAGRPALPLVALNFSGIELLCAAHPALGESIFELVSDLVQPRYARCGLMMQTSHQEFLLVFPPPSAAADAAFAALGTPDNIEAPDIDWEPVPAAYWNVPVLTEVASKPVREIHWPQATRSTAEIELGHAIERNALSVHYQPQFDMQGHGCGVEALARWTLSNGETLAPRVFIPIAERNGLIGALGASILQRACETAASWRGREVERLTLSVNVSARQIDSQYCRVLESILKGSGFPALRLELEVSETALLTDREATIDCLQQWKRLGVRIAVNHFGTNYSNLSYLARLRADRLKLDKSLIHRMTQEPKIAAVVHAVIALGAELDVEVMAEGVETESQLSMLRDLGCTHAQGFLLARPMPAVQAQIALRKLWGNLPKAAQAAAPGPARAH